MENVKLDNNDINAPYEAKHAAGSTGGGEKKPEKEEKSFLWYLIHDIAIAAILAFITLQFIGPTFVKQWSMEDTLHQNDLMIMYKLAYKSHEPERGDIIIFQSELPNEQTGDNKLLIKRIIGLPGEEIMIEEGDVYIDGEVLEEDYTKDGYTGPGDMLNEGESYTVPDGCYICMGDNRNNSTDSRDSAVGPVQFDQIEGKVVLRLFPFNKIRTF